MATVRIAKATLSLLSHAFVRISTAEERTTAGAFIRINRLDLRSYGPGEDVYVRVARAQFRAITVGSVRVAKISLSTTPLPNVTARVARIQFRATKRDRTVYAVFDGRNWVDHEAVLAIP